MNIRPAGSAAEALQSIQATRSFQAANKTGSVFRQALIQELESHGAYPTAEPHAADNIPSLAPQRFHVEEPAIPQPINRMRQQKVSPAPATNPLEPLIHDVIQVAEQTGYVGVTAQDVVRAYQTGQSLLADYTV